jgi:hypothetical protein
MKASWIVGFVTTAIVVAGGAYFIIGNDAPAVVQTELTDTSSAAREASPAVSTRAACEAGCRNQYGGSDLTHVCAPAARAEFYVRKHAPERLHLDAKCRQPRFAKMENGFALGPQLPVLQSHRHLRLNPNRRFRIPRRRLKNLLHLHPHLSLKLYLILHPRHSEYRIP